MSFVRIVERPVPMSGPEAAPNVASAIRELAASNDVVVVVRGGGPASELTVFDHPAVADAIVNSQCPVVLAVGHSTNSTLADLVAAMSVSTPTAAAVWLLDHNQTTATATREHRQRDAERLAQSQLEAAAHQSAHAQHALQEATQLAARTRKTIRFTIAGAFAISLFVVVALSLLPCRCCDDLTNSGGLLTPSSRPVPAGTAAAAVTELSCALCPKSGSWEPVDSRQILRQG